MVRDPKTQGEPIESSGEAPTPSQEQRAPPRSFVFRHTAIANPKLARDIIVRVDADFERIFGSDD